MSKSEESRADTPRRGYQKRQPQVRGGMMRMYAGWIQNDKDYRRMSVMGIMKNGADDERWMQGNLLYKMYILVDGGRCSSREDRIER